ncbi:TIGR04283 family arsenosugar biosynthesis glycosyltransferase [Euzebyella saccharophila]|uniref:TIGR04283 family arsenosugar biosynthesis glycosyltransferase n=1 Tax=Euzebyella saccharophila TaxID=679664 RepID=A0ABV8JX33_9FLAO|nr:TIGR04283 family arsenosugar biosynthesis glycosyltransferase [Euzebyella saccharophila]
MKTNKKFNLSVVIPAHNEKDNLKLLVPKLVNEGGDLLMEVIVVLSGLNSDGSEELKFGPKVKWIRANEKGRAVQMNMGAQHSQSSILAFLHADVLPPSDFAKNIVDTIASGFDAGFFSYQFDKKSILLSINAYFTAKDGLFTGGGDQCLFIEKNQFQKLNGFDESQVLMEDFEFFKRMKKSNIKYTIIKNDMLVSARKYEKNSYLRVNLSNLLLVILFKSGYSAEKLKKLHNKLLHLSYSE